MRIVTEQFIRDLLKDRTVREFHVEHGSLLSPAAKDYLNQVHVRIIIDPPKGDPEAGSSAGANPAGDSHMHDNPNAGSYIAAGSTDGDRAGKTGSRGFVDAETGDEITVKPEVMTHLFGNKLVYKNHQRMVFRGALDHLQSEIVLTQALLAGRYPEKLTLELEDVLAFVRNLMRAEVLDEPAGEIRALGLSDAELREQSHHPDAFYGVKAMTLPHYGMGEAYARLNLLRSQSRQVEIAAVSAYRDGRGVSRQDIITALNRLSSVFHIMCCRLLSGYYGG